MSNIREKSMDLPLISRFYKSSLATATRSKGGGIPRPWPPPPQSVRDTPNCHELVDGFQQAGITRRCGYVWQSTFGLLQLRVIYCFIFRNLSHMEV